MSGAAVRVARGAASQGDRLVQFGGRTLDDAVQNAVNSAVPDPNEFAETGASLGQTVVRTAGIGGGGVFAADQYFDQQRLEEEAQTEEGQRELLKEIRNDPNLSDEVKQQAIQNALEGGVFDQLGSESSNSNGDESILQNRWFQIFAAILIVIVVYRRA